MRIRALNLRKYSLAILLLASLRSISQPNNDFTKATDILPPPPDASAITKYGGLAITKNTGAPAFSIPLLSLKGVNLSTAVSLGYSSTGIKVDEIASRVGMGWALISGGVITRTVRHTPDDLRPRIVPWQTVGYNWATQNFMDRVMLSTNSFGEDSEPDLFTFNFNGYSGSFVFDADMSIVQIAPTALKIYNDFNSTSWNFKIVTPDGVSYYFGGSAATEKSKRESNCGKSFDIYIANAWYLTKIEHPNGEVINFTYTPLTYHYETGISQTMRYIDHGISDGNCPDLSPTTCVNIAITQGYLPNTIFIPGKATIQFFYQSRSDCEDKLVSSIQLTDMIQNRVVDVFDFSYQQVQSNTSYTNLTNSTYNNYTPYLSNLTHRSSDYSVNNVYQFSYLDKENRPPRLSYSQDHWGYFNGKSNQSLVPKPDNTIVGGDQTQVSRFPSATGNREADFNYAEKGLLTKIVYPTGGMDTIIYESNSKLALTPKKPRHDLVCDVTGTGFSTAVQKTFTINVDESHTGDMLINFIDNTGNGTYDPVHNKGEVQLINSSGTIFYDKLMTPGNVVHEYPAIPAGNVTVKIIANGTAITTSIVFKTYPKNVTTSTLADGPGVRVKYVITGNPGEKSMTKRYYYGDITDPENATYSIIQNPLYLDSYTDYGIVPVEGNNGAKCVMTTLFSSSINNLLPYASALVSYNSVIESDGDNFQNGATQTKFIVNVDAPGTTLLGRDIIGATKTNLSSAVNGKVSEEIVFKKNSQGTLFPLKKTKYTYKFDSRKSKIVNGYVVSGKYMDNFSAPAWLYIDTTCNTSDMALAHCGWWLTTFLNFGNIVKYNILSDWVYVDTLTETNYDENGLNPLMVQTRYFYDNENNLQLTRTETTDSKGNTKKTELKYPHDYSTQSPYNTMITNNMVAAVIDGKTYTNNTLNSEVKTNYSDWGNNNISISSMQKALNGNTLETEGTIDAYDAFGHILQFTGKDGVVNSVIWGYSNTYPVAKITGATYSQATAALGCTIQALQLMDGTTLRNQLNNIRTGITTAFVTSYTYKPLTGVTSITDPNNKTITYEYDAFNRLVNVYDNDGKVIKKMEYAYRVEDLVQASVFNIYFNQSMSQTFTPQTCKNGFGPVGINYSIPYGKYFSFISVADANAKAQQDLDLNGQAYADANGTCNNQYCSGLDKKLIDCYCSTGLKVFVSQTQTGPNTWECTFHYHFSDGSWGSNFVEIHSSPCFGGGGE